MKTKKQTKQTNPNQAINDALTIAYADHLSTLTGAYADAHLVGDTVYLSFLDGPEGDHTCMRFDEFQLFITLTARVLTMAQQAKRNAEISDLECKVANLQRKGN